MRVFFLIPVIAAIVALPARGDTPLPPQSKEAVISPSGRIRAVSDPKTGTVVEDLKRHMVLWRLPSWHRSMFVTDDGKHLVTEYNGMNLIPTDFSDDLVLLTFWREGRKIRQVTVKDLFPDHRILRRTASHYAWRRVLGLDAQGRFKVLRVDGRIFLFDVGTGKTKA